MASRSPWILRRSTTRLKLTNDMKSQGKAGVICFMGRSFMVLQRLLLLFLPRILSLSFKLLHVFSRLIPLCVSRFFHLVYEMRGGLVLRRLSLVFAVMMWTIGWVHRVAISFRYYFGEMCHSRLILFQERIFLWNRVLELGPPAPPKNYSYVGAQQSRALGSRVLGYPTPAVSPVAIWLVYKSTGRASTRNLGAYLRSTRDSSTRRPTTKNSSDRFIVL